MRDSWKKMVCGWLVMFSTSASSAQGVWFVNAANPDPGNGSENNPYKTISMAVAAASPGDTIYVASGTYDMNNDMDADLTGTHWDSDGIIISKANIQIIGYNQTIGDLDNGQGVANSYESFTETGVGSLFAPDAIIQPMPAIVGADYSGTGIQIWADGVECWNLEIVKFNAGVLVNDTTENKRETSVAENVRLRNLVVVSTGDPLLDGTGIGIWLRFIEKSTVENCLVYNSAECGIRVVRCGHDPNGQIDIDRCQVYCDNDATPYSNNSGTDYYIDIDTSFHATVTNCRVERIGGLFHGGHGYVIQARGANVAENNTFIGCEARNIDEAFFLRGDGARENLYQDCTSTLPLDPNDTDKSVSNFRRPGGGIVISTGPGNNIFRRIRTNNAENAVLFYHNNGVDVRAFETSIDNKFDNCIFYNSDIAIELRRSAYDGFDVAREETAHQIVSTSFRNCTFVIGKTFIRNNRQGTGNSLTNCIIAGFSTYQDSAPDTLTFSHGFAFNYCCVYNPPQAQFPTVRGRGLSGSNIEVNPGFSNFNTFDLDTSLRTSSPCIDAGDPSTAIRDAPYDIDGDSRPQRTRYDIGAQEATD